MYYFVGVQDPNNEDEIITYSQLNLVQYCTVLSVLRCCVRMNITLFMYSYST